MSWNWAGAGSSRKGTSVVSMGKTLDWGLLCRLRIGRSVGAVSVRSNKGSSSVEWLALVTEFRDI